MTVFVRDPRPAGESPPMTFAAPPAMTVPSRPAFHRLLVAATAADVAEQALAEAKSRYQRGPTPENREKLLAAATLALEKEVAFDETWEEVSREWFGGSPPTP